MQFQPRLGSESGRPAQSACRPLAEEGPAGQPVRQRKARTGTVYLQRLLYVGLPGAGRTGRQITVRGQDTQ